MKLLDRLLKRRAPEPRPAPLDLPTPVQPRKKVSAWAVERARQKRDDGHKRTWAMPDVPPVIQAAMERAKAEPGFAMDDQVQYVADVYGWASHGEFSEGIGFMGYPYLAELTQRGEYRLISEIRAEEMTRKWIEMQYTGKDKLGAADKLAEIDQALKDFGVKDLFYRAALNDGFFGRCQIYIDTGVWDNPAELRAPLIPEKKLKKGGLKGFRLIEPMWAYPNEYNAVDPLGEDFYVPQTWFVQANVVHASRLLLFVSRPMPDILKPAYSFGGLSLSQMAKPYVDNWLRTRQSVSDLIHSFSLTILRTDMGSTLSGGDGDDLFNRLDFFAATRDNRGIFAIQMGDKGAGEEIVNVSTPLSGLHELQEQSQHQMASIVQEPFVKLFGNTQQGLGGTADGEIRTFYDGIHALQEKVYRAPLHTVIDLVQIHLYGKIDPDVTFSFVPLWQLDEAGAAAVRKSDADTAVELINAGVIAPEEVRAVMAKDKDSPYSGIDPDDVPEPPEEDDEPVGGSPANSAEPRKAERSGV